MKPSKSETVLCEKNRLSPENPPEINIKVGSIASAGSSKTLRQESNVHLTTMAASTSGSMERHRFSSADQAFLSNLIEGSVEKIYNRLDSRISQVEDRSSKNHTLITKCTAELVSENKVINQRLEKLEKQLPSVTLSKPAQNPAPKQHSSALIFTGVSDAKKAKKVIRDLGITLSGAIKVTPIAKKKDACIVDFSCHWDKSSLYKERTNLKSKGHSGVYINEVLNQIQGKIFYLARCAKKQELIKTTWTKDGSVFISKDVDNETHIAEVKSEKHLIELVPRLVIPEDKPEDKSKAKKKWSSSKVHQAKEKKTKAPATTSSSSSSESEEGEVSGSESEPEPSKNTRSRRKPLPASKKAGSRR